MERTDSLTQRLQILRHNDSHQRAGVIDADFKTGPTAGSVAWYAQHGRDLVG